MQYHFVLSIHRKYTKYHSCGQSNHLYLPKNLESSKNIHSQYSCYTEVYSYKNADKYMYIYSKIQTDTPPGIFGMSFIPITIKAMFTTAEMCCIYRVAQKVSHYQMIKKSS